MSDNAANMKNAIRDHINKPHLGCVAHTLNLCVKDALEEDASIVQLLKKCKALVSFFKHSVFASEKLRKMQQQMGLPELKVKQDVSTRWNSSLIMMSRLNELKLPLSAVLSSLPRVPDSLDASDWNIINDIIPIFKPIEGVTEVLSGEKYSTISMIIPLYVGLHLSVSKMTTTTLIGSSLQMHSVILYRDVSDQLKTMNSLLKLLSWTHDSRK